MTATISRHDSELKQDVMAELQWDPRVSETEIGVQVKNGVVTLTGTIDSYAMKIAAREAAHRVAGVLDVADDLVIRIPGTHRKTDAELARAVRDALEWDVYIPSAKIHSTVSGGRVTLTGSVDRWTDREDALLAVQRLRGVTHVENQLVVRSPTPDGGTVRSAIERALSRQTERESRRIGVDVKDGVVTLVGTVRSWGEKNLIDRVAGFAPGVRRLEDKLVVDPYG